MSKLCLAVVTVTIALFACGQSLSGSSSLPGVTVTSPPSGAKVSGAVTLSATPAAQASRVDFAVDGAVVASVARPPYRTSWNSAAAADGTHRLEARVVWESAIVASSAVVVTVENGGAPGGLALLLATPVDGATVAGDVQLEAKPTGPVLRVDFTLDGTVVASSAAPPFSASWNSKVAGNGQHTLAARAVSASGAAAISTPVTLTVDNGIGHVFVIVMENHDWSEIKGNPSAPYINGALLPQASYAENYSNPPRLHPSLPNYIWLEAGTNFGILDDENPAQDHQSSSMHLVSLLQKAGVSWKAYQEDIPGNSCPLGYVNLYATRHNPMVYFDDVTGSNNPGSAMCISHVRPFAELATDIDADAVPAYSFITPNTCNDMHDTVGCDSSDSVANGDRWLARQVPRILASPAFRRDGALFVTWDESENGDGPIGMIVLSPSAKGKGYSNRIRYTHSSTLRSIQRIFGVRPFLGDAANATDLGDLFSSWR